MDKEAFIKLGLSISEHGKFPDVILHDQRKKRLFLIEAVTAHGLVSPKRQVELERLFEKCKASKIYVTAFLDFTPIKSTQTILPGIQKSGLQRCLLA